MIQWNIAQLIFHLTPFSNHICGRKSSSSNFSSFKLSTTKSSGFAVFRAERFDSIQEPFDLVLTQDFMVVINDNVSANRRDRPFFFFNGAVIKGPLVLFAINIRPNRDVRRPDSTAF